MVLTVYAVIITLGWVATSIYVLVNSRKISYLKKVSTVAEAREPSVAIIIAVKDEEAEVEQALNSVCNLDYNNFKVIVINDRSTDRTPEILNKMTLVNPAISVITVKELPKGWLGKNHALYQGYRASSEEWLLFTDADINYNKQGLTKAMNYATANRLDHLTALPEITSRSTLFVSVMNTFATMLEIRLRPWNVSNPNSPASIGIGAFNLVKRSAYEKAGTHTVISLRPDDDLKLGALIKKAGLRQDVVYGEGEISLQWYTSLSEFVKGLMKNTFSVANYHLPTAIASALLTFVVFVLPIPLLLFMGQTGLLLGVIILLSQILLMSFKKGIHGKWWHALMIPLSGSVMMYIIVKSAFKTLQQGGIYWRDSFYPLEELKKQR
jgi:cellulose synthase/poly-beta-1,6-N-acetylglucosamine synthase-like glycosyltransferase